MNITVLGAGSWGTSFARLTATLEHPTVLWARREELATTIDEELTNPQYLPGVDLPESQLQPTSDLPTALNEVDLVIFAVPSFALRRMAVKAREYISNPIATINLAKGIEEETFTTMSEILNEVMPGIDHYTLSGPSHAEEVAKDYPTAVVLVGENLQKGSSLQQKLSSSRFRIYLSSDTTGIEYCGVIKNIIAIGAGISQGLGYGDNTTGALIARGLAEMVRFGDAMGANKQTFFGLAGVGDLVATCTSKHSRNRRVGEKLGQGKSLDSILEQMDMVAEGVYTVQTIKSLADQKQIVMPITNAVNKVLYEGANPLDQVDSLLTREYKKEDI